MSKLAHICFTLIIYKQFNFCRFRASAYTNVNRLCAVFLYNICGFMISLKLVHLLKVTGLIINVNSLQEWRKHRKLFSKWPPSAILNLGKLQFWSRDLYWHVILHLLSEFRVDWSIRRRDIDKNDFQYGVRPPSWIWKISIFCQMALSYYFDHWRVAYTTACNSVQAVMILPQFNVW